MNDHQTNPTPHIDRCDRCGAESQDIDAGFCPSLQEMVHSCGGTWARLDRGTYTLQRDGAADVRCCGYLIAEVSSHEPRDDGQNRWTEIRLYRTVGGKLIAAEEGISQWEGETTRHQVYVCDDEAALIHYLGSGWLGKELYRQAGIRHVEEVE